MSRARLRGGGGQRQVGFFGWLRKGQGVNENLDEGKSREDDTVVTYKGRKIGAPQPMFAPDVLPPASGFVQLHKDSTFVDTAPRPPFQTGYDTNGDRVPTPCWQDCHTPARTSSPIHPLVPAFNITRPRPVTSNPFANIYGNPNIVRAAPTAPPIDYAVAGSLINRPSALDGSQTGYYHASALPNKNVSRGSGGAAAGIAESDNFGMKLAAQKMRVDRKWDKLPALPPGESPPGPVPKDDRPAEMEMEDEVPFDTEEILRSLRPERLSLYHINMPGQTASDCVEGNQQSLAITPPIPHDTISNKENPANIHGYKSSDNLSIHIRDWDLQSCTTDELSIDAHLQHQDRLVQHPKSHPIPQHKPQQTAIRNTKDPLHGIPNENASSPESAFYTALIDMVQHHHEQRRVLQRALEAGEILTNEASIRNAITKPTGYAIYSALLASRDPEKWQRLFAFTPTSALPPFKPTINQDPAGPKSLLIKRFREAGRALRSLFVAPDSALGRHEPYAGASVCKAKVDVLDTHTPSRQRFVDAAVQTTPPPPPPSHNQNLAHTQHHSSQVAALAPGWSKSTTLNGATSTDARLAPVTTQYTQPLHMRGYDADVFVTVLSGDGDLSTFGAGRFAGTQQDGCKGGGKLEMGTEMENEVWEGGSAVTEWPRVGW